MGDSNSAGAKTILRSGTNSAAKATVAAAFTRAGTVKKGASKAIVERAKKVISTARNRKIAGRTRRKTNAAAKATTQAKAAAKTPLGRNAQRQALNRARLRGD